VNNTGGVTLGGVVGEAGGAQDIDRVGTGTLGLASANSFTGGFNLSTPGQPPSPLGALGIVANFYNLTFGRAP